VEQAAIPSSAHVLSRRQLRRVQRLPWLRYLLAFRLPLRRLQRYKCPRMRGVGTCSTRLREGGRVLGPSLETAVQISPTGVYPPHGSDADARS
jgi:hypothetical protein